MSALRIVLVDDEPLARVRLRLLVGECQDPEVEVVFEASNAAQALGWLAEHECDLLLLDIHMPGLDGVELATELRQRRNPPAVVFVTAHPEYALAAFDLEAIDYLTKPVRRERLQAALQRVVQRLMVSQNDEATQMSEAGSVIVVNSLDRKIRVPLCEVLYLKAELKYVTLRTATHTHILDDTLTDLETRLGDSFLRIHRNALVARGALRALERRMLPGEGGETAVEGWVVRVAPVDEWLTVSRRQVGAVKEAIAQGGV